MIDTASPTVTSPTRRHDAWLAGMAALTLASGWLGAALNRALGEPHSMESPGTLLWLVTPLAGVLVVRLLKRSDAPGGWRPHLPKAWPWYLVALATFPAVAAVNVALGSASGHVDASGFRLQALAGTFATLIGASLVKNVFEEAVWRGYFTSEFLARGWKDGPLYLAAGLIWGLWHVPYYVFFLPTEQMQQVMSLPRPGFAAVAALVMVAWGVAFTELFRASGSVWPVVLLHAVEDSFLNNMVFDGHVRVDPDAGWLFSPILGVVPAALLAGVGLGLRAWRRRPSAGPLRSA